MLNAVVTGANKGIGYEIAKGLAQNPNVRCILTSRNKDLGMEAVKKLADEGYKVEYFCVDVTVLDTIKSLAAYLESIGGLDILVNNAGIAYKGKIFGPKEAQITLETNFYGVINMCQTLLPLMRNRSHKGRIINVCSSAGRLSQVSSGLQQKFSNPNITLEELKGLASKFVQDIDQGRHKEEGWPDSMYGISKLSEISYSLSLAKQLEKDGDVYVNAMCPGYCKTDMSSIQGTRSAAEGADTALWLALHPIPSPHGQFIKDRQSVQW